MLSLIFQVLLAYVIGSIPTGYWVGKAKGIDIRKVGSGSTGATNVYRSVGKAAGIFVMVVDLLKGYLPVIGSIYLSKNLTIEMGPIAYSISDLTPVAVALATIIGHSKSIFLQFTGGKSAATGLGTMIALCPPAGGLTFVTWLALVFAFKYVSLASFTSSAINVLYFWLFHAPTAFVIYSALGSLYVIIRHKSNIQRLLNGTEPKISGKAKPPEAKETK